MGKGVWPSKRVRCDGLRTPQPRPPASDQAYSREQAVFPAGVTPHKYWAPVGRIDQAHGDRNLVCACPPPNPSSRDPPIML